MMDTLTLRHYRTATQTNTLIHGQKLPKHSHQQKPKQTLTETQNQTNTETKLHNHRE